MKYCVVCCIKKNNYKDTMMHSIVQRRNFPQTFTQPEEFFKRYQHEENGKDSIYRIYNPHVKVQDDRWHLEFDIGLKIRFVQLDEDLFLKHGHINFASDAYMAADRHQNILLDDRCNKFVTTFAQDDTDFAIVLDNCANSRRVAVHVTCSGITFGPFFVSARESLMLKSLKPHGKHLHFNSNETTLLSTIRRSIRKLQLNTRFSEDKCMLTFNISIDKRENAEIPVIVNMMGTDRIIHMSRLDTIAELKQRIYIRYGFPIDSQRIYASQLQNVPLSDECQDELTIFHYKLHHNTAVFVTTLDGLMNKELQESTSSIKSRKDSMKSKNSTDDDNDNNNNNNDDDDDHLLNPESSKVKKSKSHYGIHCSGIQTDQTFDECDNFEPSTLDYIPPIYVKLSCSDFGRI